MRHGPQSLPDEEDQPLFDDGADADWSSPPPDEPGDAQPYDSADDPLSVGFEPAGVADFAPTALGEVLRPRGADRSRAAATEAAPPSDLGAERALLASCLIDELTVAQIQGVVAPDDFYDPRHASVFRAVQTLVGSGRAVDPVTVHGVVSSDPAAAQPGELYLTELVAQFAGNPQNAVHYAERIAKLGRMRRIVAATHKLSAAGYQRGADPDAFVDLVQEELNKALAEVSRGGPVHIAGVVGDVFGEVLAARERGSEVVGISTGFREIDQRLLGLHRTDLLVLAARPAMGKTAFALTLALNVARQTRRHATSPTDRHNVVVFSLEMGREQLAARLLSQHARVANTQMRKGEVDAEEELRLREAAAELSELNIFLDDSGTVTPQDVRARCKQLVMQHGQLDLVVIDYLQLMHTTGGPKQSREQQVSEVSRSMKALAKELRCTVLALSQLNRGVEQRTDKRPMMSDLRESGAIEQDADIIAFIYRDWVYNKDAPEHLAELIVAKQRAGQTGTIQLHFDGSLTRFANLDHRANDDFAFGH